MWLLYDPIKKELEKRHLAQFSVSAEVLATYEASLASIDISKVVSTTAVISIDGILTQKPDVFAAMVMGGNVTYSDIADALMAAQDNPKIDAIQLNVDSPGGEVAGLFNLLDVVKGINKPITAVVDNLAASAAYAIISQADTIVATNKAAMVGSIGVVSTFWVSEEMVAVTSTNAPEKRPDVTTDEGKAVVRKELDALEKLFIDDVAMGRGVTSKEVKTNFGRGSVVLADEALQRGMIDRVAVTTAKISKQSMEAKIMVIDDLKKEHSELYAQVFNEGVKCERDRASAHLTLGEASGDMKTALEAIHAGDDITAVIQAKHLAAKMNRTDASSRADDNPETVAVDVDKSKTEAEAIVAGVEALVKR